ncbi:hypothetical protein [Francisella sp. TX07-6608]|uniref:hypothetical protein n=1 Tax=Francisella sp. TX07-6608 TaxID=573568 RepID=UPI0008F9AEE8|nr:hypothetical protein [Francisella sp. TX07-6608]OIN82982.1 hypothetical protein KX00_2034 [Francisella sp. TX07-6608]OIN85128.1 hypothetical protein KX00_2189 [Francisella sp. TX07-6608]
MFEKNNNIAYSFTGLQNLITHCNYALNNNSIIKSVNDWVAVAIQYLAIGKAAGISCVNVLNRPITKNLFPQRWCSAVKTFMTAIAVSECFKSFKSNSN